MSVRSGPARGRSAGGGLRFAAHRLRALTRARSRSGRRRLPIVLAVIALLGGLLAGGWFWLRDSALVAVHRVQISGLSGPDVGAIHASLTAAARSMTTLDVQLGVLHEAVSPYPEVKRLRVSTQFPHGMRIAVIEQVPVAVVDIGSQPVPVAADGTLLRDSHPDLEPAHAGGERPTRGHAGRGSGCPGRAQRARRRPLRPARACDFGLPQLLARGGRPAPPGTEPPVRAGRRCGGQVVSRRGHARRPGERRGGLHRRE